MGREGRPPGRRLILAAAAALLVSEAHRPPLIYITQCKMEVCSWVQERSRHVVLRNRDGKLVRYDVMQGMSHHPDDDYPSAYRPGLRIGWERKTDYAFCSKSRPALVWLDDLDRRRHWVAHLLDLTSLFGYNMPSAVTYMHACHRMGPGGEASAKRLKQFGYHPGTPSAQITLKRPADIADRRLVMSAVAAAKR